MKMFLDSVATGIIAVQFVVILSLSLSLASNQAVFELSFEPELLSSPESPELSLEDDESLI